jgi:hypothetical protein
MEMDPEEPPDAWPVLRDKIPEFPALLEPDRNLKLPLIPATPALPVSILILPLMVPAPAPDFMSTKPPVAKELEPATM